MWTLMKRVGGLIARITGCGSLPITMQPCIRLIKVVVARFKAIFWVRSIKGFWLAIFIRLITNFRPGLASVVFLGIFWLKIKKAQEKNKLAPESIDGMFCQELKTVLKRTIDVWNEYHEGRKVFEDLAKEKEQAISRMVELLSLPIKHKDVRLICKRIIRYNQELFTFLDNPLVEPTNNRSWAAVEAKCHHEKDNLWQSFKFRRFKPRKWWWA